jgi:hypothetical protein
MENRISLGRIVQIIAALIAIVVFITGYDHLPEFLDYLLKDNPFKSTPELNYEVTGQVWDSALEKPHKYDTNQIITDNVNDFVAEVDLQLDDGVLDEFHGILFRQSDSQTFYTFRINGKGQYSFSVWAPCETNSGSACSNDVLGPAYSDAIQVGLGIRNRLKVIATRTNFEFYVNGEKVASATNTTLSSGKIGLLSCTCQGGASSRVSFYDIKISNR